MRYRPNSPVRASARTCSQTLHGTIYVHHRLAVAVIGGEVPYAKTVLPFAHSCLCCIFQWGHFMKTFFCVCDLYGHHQH